MERLGKRSHRHDNDIPFRFSGYRQTNGTRGRFGNGKIFRHARLPDSFWNLLERVREGVQSQYDRGTTASACFPNNGETRMEGRLSLGVQVEGSWPKRHVD